MLLEVSALHVRLRISEPVQYVSSSCLLLVVEGHETFILFIYFSCGAEDRAQGLTRARQVHYAPPPDLSPVYPQGPYK